MRRCHEGSHLVAHSGSGLGRLFRRFLATLTARSKDCGKASIRALYFTDTPPPLRRGRRCWTSIAPSIEWSPRWRSPEIPLMWPSPWRHGMGENHSAVPSLILLPKRAYRAAFGETFLQPPRARAARRGRKRLDTRRHAIGWSASYAHVGTRARARRSCTLSSPRRHVTACADDLRGRSGRWVAPRGGCPRTPAPGVHWAAGPAGERAATGCARDDVREHIGARTV